MDDDYDIFGFDSSYDESYNNSYYDDDRYYDSYEEDRYSQHYYESLYEDDVLNSATQYESIYSHNGYGIEEEPEDMLEADDVDELYDKQLQETLTDENSVPRVQNIETKPSAIITELKPTSQKRFVTKAEDDFEKFFSQ